MRDTIVIQSHRSPLPYAWIEACVETVRNWAAGNNFSYQWLGEELFDSVPGWILDKTKHQRVIATDIARLKVLDESLGDGYQTVIWLDADFLIFDSARFLVPDSSYAVGREIWVQRDPRGKLKTYKKVHNAFLMFRRGNSFLPFYTEVAERLLLQNKGTMPPQFVGPKLLTALHNAANLPVMETAAMFSPLVVRDLLNGNGAALEVFKHRMTEVPAGANLCVSSCDQQCVSRAQMTRLVEQLRQQGAALFLR